MTVRKSDGATEVKTHSLLSSSSSERWLECAGSIALSQRPECPVPFENDYAKEGTDAHYCLEQILRHPGKELSTAAFLKKTYPTEMVEWALWAWKEVLKLSPKGALIRPEIKVSLTHLDPDMGGTLDVSIIEAFGWLIIADYKYGSGVPVEPEKNTQLLSYAIGVAHEFDYNFERVKLVVLQPRAPHEKGPVRSWELSIDELIEWEAVFAKGAKATRDPKAPLKSGPWCRWCPAKIICPEISRKALAQAKIDFAPEEEKLKLPDPHSIIDPKTLGTTLTLMERVELWISELRAHAFEQIKRGKEIPGWKTVEKRSIRKWTNEEMVIKEAKREFGDKAFKIDLLSPNQMEEVAPIDWIKKRCSAKSSGLTLADASDPRPAVTQAQLDFKVQKGDEDDVPVKTDAKLVKPTTKPKKKGK